jgi:hypothetical protein
MPQSCSWLSQFFARLTAKSFLGSTETGFFLPVVATSRLYCRLSEKAMAGLSREPYLILRMPQTATWMLSTPTQLAAYLDKLERKQRCCHVRSSLVKI